MQKKKMRSIPNAAVMFPLLMVLIKIIDVLFKMPMTSLLGAVGRGYFNSAYEFFVPVVTLAATVLPAAISKTVSENAASGHFRDARLAFRLSNRLFLIAGICISLVMLIPAFLYAYLLTGTRNLPSIICIIPCILLCCFSASYKGYYEGLFNRIPGVLSQTIEALGKFFIGLAFVKMAESSGISQFNSGMSASGNSGTVVFGVAVTNLSEAGSAIASRAATCGVLGITIAYMLSTIFCIAYFRMKGYSLTRSQILSSPKAQEGSKIVKDILKSAAPFAVASLILTIAGFIDAVTVLPRLNSALQNEEGFNFVTNLFSNTFKAASAGSRINLTDTSNVVRYLWGAYGTALDFNSIAPAATLFLGAAVLPAISRAWNDNNREITSASIESVVRCALAISIPTGLCMAVLSKPILNLFYARGAMADAISLIAPMIVIYGLIAFLTALAVPVTNMLQAIGCNDIAVKSLCVAAVVKLICNIVLIGIYQISIYGAVIGTLLFYGIIVGTNYICLVRISQTRMPLLDAVLRPFAASVICVLSAYAVNALLGIILPAGNTGGFFNGKTISTLISVVFAAVVYTIGLVFVKGIKKDDVYVLFKGEKIAKMLEKYGLLS